MSDTSVQDFFPDTENVRLYINLLKTQGVEVCQHKLERDWIGKSLNRYSHGKIYFRQKAHIRRRSLKRDEDKFLVHGFVLCRMDETNKEMAWIDVVCSRENSKVGRLLMEMIEQYCRSIPSIKMIQLMCLPEVRLKKWYVDLGFFASDITIWDGKKPKAYLMQKFLRC